MKNCKRVILWICMCLLFLPMAGKADCAVSARMCDGQMVIKWNLGNETCDGGMLTLYRNNWPVLVCCANGTTGSYAVPVWYTNVSGVYKVRLTAGNCCVTATVNSCSDEDMEKPATTAAPANTPIPAPTQAPVAPTKAPVNPTQAPVAPTKAPVAPTKAPTAPTKSPVNPTQAPVAPTKAPDTGAMAGGLAQQMIALVNQDRAASGAGSVTQDANLTQAACVRAKEIVSKFSHTRPDGSSWSTVYSGAYGENIAKGYATADKCEAAFMSSQGHRENILRASYTKIGVCAYTVGNVTYWVQLFGK